MKVPCIRMIALMLSCTLCASCATSSLVSADDPIAAVLDRSHVRIGDASYQRVGRYTDTLIYVVDAAQVHFENPNQRLYERNDNGASYNEREVNTAFVELHPGITPLIRNDSLALPIGDISRVRVLAAQPGNLGTGTIILLGVLGLLATIILTADYYPNSYGKQNPSRR